MAMLKAPVLIEGVRLRLRRSTPADAAFTYAAAHNIDVMRYMDWPAHRAQADARAYLEGCAARWDAGSEFHWIIEHKASGQGMGEGMGEGIGESIGAIACRPHGHAVDFGYFLARSHWGQGLGREAALLLVGWLQRQPSVQRVWATVDAENARSAAVLVKAGLQHEGVMRKATLRPNMGPPFDKTPRDTALYAWVREERGEKAA